jgi:hypothetical protein
MKFKLTGNYGTFVIERVVEATDQDEAFTMTGIGTTLTAAGWTIVEPPEGEEWEIEEFVGKPEPRDWHATIDAVEAMVTDMSNHDRNDAIEALRSRFEEIYDRDSDELNDDERKAVELIDGDERLASFAAGCGSDDLEERLIDETERNDLDINLAVIDFVKVMNYYQSI